MKLIMCILFVLIATKVSAQTKFEFVMDLVNQYQASSYKIYGDKLSFRIVDREDMPDWGCASSAPLNRCSLASGTNPEITINDEAMEKLNHDELIILACHELGHLFGKVRPNNDIKHPTYESEADYFGGACAMEFFINDYDRVMTSVESLLSKTYDHKLEFIEGLILDDYDGVQEDYANPYCRLLTFSQGAMGYKRPKCWYNP